MNDTNCRNCGKFTSGDPVCCDPAEACTVDGCHDEVKARGWCCKHLQRWYHHGHTGLVDEPKPRRDAARHGTRYRYQTGCRCFDCRLAQHRYQRDWRDNGGRRVPVADVLPHVEALLDAGWTARDIEREADVGNTTVWRLRRTEQTHVNSRTAERLLSLPLPDDPWIDPGPLEAALRAKGPIKTLLPEAADRKRFYCAVREGRVNEAWADRIACTVLGMPLPLLYGTDYDQEAA